MGVYPSEGMPIAMAPVAILKGALRPNAARLFVDYVLSREGSTLPPRWFSRMARIRPRAGGLLVPAVKELGRELGPEAVLGRVIHPQTFAGLEVIRTPFRRNVTILVHRTATSSSPAATTTRSGPGDRGYATLTSRALRRWSMTSASSG